MFGAFIAAAVFIASSSLRAKKKRKTENSIFRAHMESFLTGTSRERRAELWGGTILAINDRPTQYIYEKFALEFNQAQYLEAAGILAEYLKERSPGTAEKCAALGFLGLACEKGGDIPAAGRFFAEMTRLAAALQNRDALEFARQKLGDLQKNHEPNISRIIFR